MLMPLFIYLFAELFILLFVCLWIIILCLPRIIILCLNLRSWCAFGRRSTIIPSARLTSFLWMYNLSILRFFSPSLFEYIKFYVYYLSAAIFYSLFVFLVFPSSKFYDFNFFASVYIRLSTFSSFLLLLTTTTTVRMPVNESVCRPVMCLYRSFLIVPLIFKLNLSYYYVTLNSFLWPN